MIDRATLEAEKADAIRQRDEAQARINAAIQAQQQAQAAALIAEGAVQQIDALLAMLDKPPLKAVPSKPNTKAAPES